MAAPRNWKPMKGSTDPGAMPAKVSVRDRPMVTAGLANDVDEVKNGLECGIRLGRFNDYEENDVIECYELEKIALTL